jgi:hypothetical protein
MKTIIYLLVMTLLAGCAAQEDKPSTQDITQAVIDFIEVRDLEPLESLKSGTSDSWRTGVTNTLFSSCAAAMNSKTIRA